MLLFMKSRLTGYCNVFRLAISPAENTSLLLVPGTLELCLIPLRPFCCIIKHSMPKDSPVLCVIVFGVFI